MKYVAHRSEDKEREQSVAEHLKGTAGLTKEFAGKFGAGDLGYSIGLYHDLGKYSDEFQERIRGKNISVDHSTAGGKYLSEANKNMLGRIAAYCIFGHHGGMPDGGTSSDTDGVKTLAGRLKRDLFNYDSFKKDDELGTGHELLSEPTDFKLEKNKEGFSLAFLTRMLYSALVDADWLDTEAFMSNGEIERGGFDTVDLLLDKLNLFFQKGHKAANLNYKRDELLSYCVKKASAPRGLFTLTAPTGSGKTLSSAAFALNHAVTNGHDRIIYVVPYNTIIEQNAKVFEDIFGEENVLQHHSGVNYDSDENKPDYKKLLATENWDAPFIVTSSVRFFEGLYGSKSSVCRKLHNIANSVIVLDEAQMIPLPYLIPCVQALKELVLNYGCTVVLATATQSSLDEYFKPLIATEIVEKPQEMYEFFRRVTYEKLEGALTCEDVANRMKSHKQVLCIVNTRKNAQVIAKLLGDDAYHLSTTMVPAHRTRVLDKIRKRLKEGKPCRVVSTSMVEAGVDVDFPIVYREEAGLDSIIQAGGRCNREGKESPDNSKVYVFTLRDSAQTHIKQNIAAYKHAERNNEDIDSLEAIEMYFKQLRKIIGKEGLDKNAVIEDFNRGQSSLLFPFKKISEKFKLIKNSTHAVIVPFNEDAEALIARLRRGERSRELFRAVQQYSVSLYEGDIKKLFDIGGIEYVNMDDKEILVLLKTYYEEQCGVSLSPEGGKGVIC